MSEIFGYSRAEILRLSVTDLYTDSNHLLQFQQAVEAAGAIKDFEAALKLNPKSITSDFHISEWGLMGRGSGENGSYL